MGLKDQMVNIGKKGFISVGGMTVGIEILDFKVSYGKERWLVKPVVGKGEVWVEEVDINK